MLMAHPVQTGHISRAPWPHVARGYRFGWGISRAAEKHGEPRATHSLPPPTYSHLLRACSEPGGRSKPHAHDFTQGGGQTQKG